VFYVLTKASFIGMSVVAGLLLNMCVAQTTIITPSNATDDCGSKDCLDTESKFEAIKPDVKTYPARQWQVNDVAQEQMNARPSGKTRGKRGREEEHSKQPLWDEADTEFQKFVYQSAGVHLPIFGRDFFVNTKQDVDFKDRVAVPPDYTLAVGDQILIHVWGQIEINSLVVVDRSGQILLPKVGAITVVGKRFDELQEYLKNSLSRLFKRFDLSVSLGQLHRQKVIVTGNVRRPGYYILPPLTTLLTALSRAGGPAGNGTLRHVKIKHRYQGIVDVDLYDLLNGGDSKDLLLQSGDTIYVPPVGPLVAVFGSINRPAIYELREDASVGSVIEQTGGLSPTADFSRITLETIDEHHKRKVEAFALDDQSRTRPLKDGDILHVFPISPAMENVVTLRGNVANPGRFPWHQGMRIRDLIPSSQFLITDQYWSRQNAYGQPAKAWIERKTKSKDRLPNTNGRQDSGHSGDLNVTDPDRAMGNSNKGMASISKTEIRHNRTEINWDYAVVQRIHSDDLSSQLIPFNLGRALRDAASSDNLSLQDGDVITIFSQQDLEVPVEKRTKFVRIEGEVAAAGVYDIRRGERLSELIARAGGLTPQAYLFAADFRRKSTRREQEEKLARMVDEMERELHSRASRIAAGNSPEERQAAAQELDSEKQVIERLRHTQATGRIVLDLKTSDTNISALPAISLEDGDSIVVPSTPATVEVVGAVYNQNSFLYRPGKNIADYLRESGGGMRDADTQRLFLIRADGSVVSKQMHRGIWGGNFESLKLMPGDTIVMPSRIRTGSWIREIRDWSQIFSQFALGAAALRVISP